MRDIVIIALTGILITGGLYSQYSGDKSHRDDSEADYEVFDSIVLEPVKIVSSYRPCVGAVTGGLGNFNTIGQNNEQE